MSCKNVCSVILSLPSIAADDNFATSYPKFRKKFDIIFQAPDDTHEIEILSSFEKAVNLKLSSAANYR